MYGWSRPFARAIWARAESYSAGSGGSRLMPTSCRRTGKCAGRSPTAARLGSPTPKVGGHSFAGGHGTPRWRADEGRVLRHHAGAVACRWRRPPFESPCDLVRRHVEIERGTIHVDDDGVALLDDRDRPTERGFRRDVADHQPMGSAREAAVGQECHGIAETLADECRRHGQHLLHPWTADRALVADHDDVAGIDRLRSNGVVAGGLRVEDARGAGVLAALVSGELDDAPFRCERAVEDREPAVGLERG